MKNKVVRTIVAILVALTCTFTLLAPVLETRNTTFQVAKTRPYDGGGSGG